jgi:hypothetical protein
LRCHSSAGASPIFSSVPGGRDEVEQQFAPARRPQAERDALLVARVKLPVDADAVRLPGAQRVAFAWVFNLDDLGAEIGELRGDRVAGDETRHVDDANAVERAGGIGLETLLRHGHFAVSSAAAVDAANPIAAGDGSKAER